MRSTLLIVMLASGCALDVSDTQTEVTTASVVSLTFDDTLADQYQVGAMVAARQMQATFYVNSPRIGQSITLDQALTLQQDGNELGGHTLAHLRLPLLDSDQVLREICNDRVALLNLGLQASTFAYPYGDDTPGIQRAAQLCGYNAARDSQGLGCRSCPHAGPIPPANLYRIPSVGGIDSSTTLAELEQYVIDAENNGGGWVPLVFHHICDGCSTYGVSPTLLGEFLDWLENRRATTGTAVETVAEVIGGSLRPGVDGPALGPAANMVMNPSFELDGNTDHQADCWEPRSTGTNSASYALSSSAYDGSVAQRMTITSYTSGARRMMTRRDCAPAVTPGQTYTITSWYYASTPPRYTVYYRTTSGSWALLVESAQFPTSSSYVQATYTTPALPSNATAISVGFSISGVGSITMDAFTMKPVLATTSSPQMIQNRSLEVDANGDSVPDCWQRGGFGTNTATFTLTNQAHEGSVAQQITISSYTSGARRLVTRQDSGACAPAAIPGHRYAVTGWYIANAPPRFTIYYRNTSGSWVYFTGSSQFPTSSTYAQASYTTPALPSDATAISIGLSLYSTGTLIVDDFTMFDTSATSIDSTPPSVAVTSPANGATVSGTVTLQATASDAGGVSKVDFRINDRLEDWDDSSPYSISWRTPSTNGTYVITARAFDRAGNVTTSAPVTVTVSN